jgi:uncharacterized protein
MPVIGSLIIYPLKSARGVDVERMELDERGPRGDRRWMLVDEQNTFISLREVPRLAFLSASLTPNGLRLFDQNGHSLEVEQPRANGSQRAFVAQLWDAQCPVLAADESAHAWVSEFLGARCRLVFQPDDSVRELPRRNAGRLAQSRTLALTDGAAVLLTSEASLADLNARLPAPIPMSRFRPNIVATGTVAYEEDSWHRIAAGDVEFEVARGCPRCVATTVDQTTGETGAEPLRTLSRYRRAPHGVLFGQNIVHLAPGSVSAGDEIRVID